MAKISHKRAAATGAAFLDEFRPGWHDLIDTDTLRMEHGSACILGQVFGGWSEASDLITDEIGINTFKDNWQYVHGFMASVDGNAEDLNAATNRAYNTLTLRWKQEIRARQA